MHPRFERHSENGFSIVEMLVAITVMLIVTGAVFSLMRDSVTVTAVTYELTDAEESLRTAQEYINRDLMNAGDGLQSISKIRVPTTFVSNYLTLNPITEAAMPAGVINLGILTSDNNVPAGTAVMGSNPATTVRANTDRQTILEVDPQFTPITVAAININSTAGTLKLSSVSGFAANEVYFLISSNPDLGGAFGAITSIDTLNKRLTFGDGDALGLNTTGNTGPLGTISAIGTIPITLHRMRIIHYYVNSSGFLMRRVFGVAGAGFAESMIAEHVLNVQFNYGLNLTNADGSVVQPTATLSTPDERINVRQVEVTATVETPHALSNGSRQQISASTSTSVRNMQFRTALQPTAR